MFIVGLHIVPCLIIGLLHYTSADAVVHTGVVIVCITTVTSEVWHRDRTSLICRPVRYLQGTASFFFSDLPTPANADFNV